MLDWTSMKVGFFEGSMTAKAGREIEREIEGKTCIKGRIQTYPAVVTKGF